MAGNFENALVTKIIQERDIRSVIKQKIGVDFFFSTSGRAAYTFLIDWYKNPKYSDTPSWEVFMDTFPDFEPEDVNDSIVALCDKVREQKLYSDIAASIQHVADVTSGDAMEGFQELKKQTARLTTLHTVDDSSDVRDRIEEIRNEYLAMKTGATGLKGRPYPWDTLNNATLGGQDGQVVILYGRPKSYKTWLALKCIQNFEIAGARVGIFSQELSDLEIARRYVALSTNVDYGKFLRGQLDPEVERDFLANLESFAEKPPIVTDMLQSVGEDVSIELAAKIDEGGYNVILIDGAHTIGRDWKELGLITKGIKRVTKQKRILTLLTTHANRSGKKAEVGGTADDMAHSDSFFQDCDMALRCVCDIENRRAHEAVIWTAAVREGETCAFVVNTRLCMDLSEKRAIRVGGDEQDPEQAIDDAQLDSEEDTRTEE